MDDNKKLHLEFIQNNITRMNTNSFQIKSLTITIIAALLAVFASTQKITYVFIGIPIAIIFWFLDSYYLLQERKFRGVYNDVANITQCISVKPFEMPIEKYTSKISKGFSFLNVLISKTTIWIYLSIIVFLGITGAILTIKECVL